VTGSPAAAAPPTARGRPVRATLAAAALALCACGPSGPPDLWLVTVDTLRADRVGAYGAEDARTPVFDRLAEQGRLFEQATTPFPRTTPALGSLMTGLRPARHGSRDVGQPVRSGTTLAEILQEAGYATLAVSANPVAGRKQNLHRGFDVFVGRGELPRRGRAEIVTERLLELAARAPEDRPLFAWAHYLDPHFTYDPPPEYEPEDAPPCRRLMRRTKSGVLHLGSVFYNRRGVAARALDSCTGLYDGEIAYADAEVGRLLEGLRRIRPREALVVWTSDHGENLGEDGLYYDHGPSVHDAGLRVPLVLAGPGVAPGRDAGVLRLQDLQPTLLALLGVEPPEGASPDGRDLSARVRGAAPNGDVQVAYAEGSRMRRSCLDSPRFTLCTPPDGEPLLYDRRADPRRTRDIADERPDVVAELLAETERLRQGAPRERAVRTPRFKLVERPLLGAEPERVLYDLAADPQETRDVSDRHPEVAAVLAAELEARADRTSDAPAPEPSPAVREALRELGYVD